MCLDKRMNNKHGFMQAAVIRQFEERCKLECQSLSEMVKQPHQNVHKVFWHSVMERTTSAMKNLNVDVSGNNYPRLVCDIRKS